MYLYSSACDSTPRAKRSLLSTIALFRTTIKVWKSVYGSTYVLQLLLDHITSVLACSYLQLLPSEQRRLSVYHLVSPATTDEGSIEMPVALTTRVSQGKDYYI